MSEELGDESFQSLPVDEALFHWSDFESDETSENESNENDAYESNYNYESDSESEDQPQRKRNISNEEDNQDYS